jgi:hypothetical protein
MTNKTLALAAVAAALLSGCASSPTVLRPLPRVDVGVAPVLPAPPADRAFRPYAASLPPVDAVRTEPVLSSELPPLADVLAEEEVPFGTGPSVPDPAAPGLDAAGPAEPAFAAPRPNRPYAAPSRSSWGGRKLSPERTRQTASAEGPKPYQAPRATAATLAGGNVTSPWADASVASADRASFNAAVIDAAGTGSGNFVTADGETMTASRLRPSGGCVEVEVVGTKDGGATVSRRGSARACPR